MTYLRSIVKRFFKNINIISLSFILPLLTFNESSAEIFSPVVGSDLMLGSGYNSLNGKTGGNCVEVGPLVTMSSTQEVLMSANAQCSPSGQCVEFNLLQLTSAKDLRSSLELDPKTSFGIGPYSVDAGFKFYEQNKFTKNNIYVFLNVKVTNTTERLRDFRLTQAARDLLGSGDASRFLRRCGDSFISGRTTGGEFSSIIKIETHSDENKREIELKLGAGGFGWNANARVQDAIREIRSTNNVSINMFKKGGITSLPDHSNIEEIFNFARNVPVTVQSNSAAVSTYLLTSTSYDAILDMPIDPIGLREETEVLGVFAENRDSAFEQWGDADFVSRHPTQFEVFIGEELRTYMSGLNAIIQSLSQSARGCERDIRNCQLPNITWPTYQLPKRRAQEHKINQQVNVQAEHSDAIKQSDARRRFILFLDHYSSCVLRTFASM